MKKVIIIQRILPHYRVKFFRKLHEELSNVGIDLFLIYGQEKHGTVPVSIDSNDVWAVKIYNRYISFLGKEVIWQPCIDTIKNCDLVIAEQAGRLLLNYLLLSVLSKNYKKIAYWGHGRNMQGCSDSIMEKIKTRLINKVDWWFLYTNININYLTKFGVKKSTISIVNNSIDTDELSAEVELFSNTNKNHLKKNLGIESDKVALFCGGLYPGKDLQFLIEACLKVKESISDFEIIFIGSGPDENILQSAIKNYTWINYVGAKYGKERVPYFIVSDVFLMPSSVGLAIIDCFVTNTPLITTDIQTHGPEISYLSNAINGYMTKYSVAEYSKVIIRYLSSSEEQNKLIEGCKQSAGKYSLDEMVKNFAQGIQLCLS